LLPNHTFGVARVNGGDRGRLRTCTYDAYILATRGAPRTPRSSRCATRSPSHPRIRGGVACTKHTRDFESSHAGRDRNRRE